ncbi:hypothetical protein [uncultured Thiocystis sp.]|jgi:hypothetical protein|uniref:hypothetical protein n=1 Tax=uncultured Thiocystis sp. TaxID=1202134 RepID=UPI0025EB5B08|nr:hypothetical protein [uncultured Thiocystis sp.]
MGGMGSGEYQSRRKGTTTRWRSLDIRQLARQGLLHPGAWTTWSWSLGSRSDGSVRFCAIDTTLEVDYRRPADDHAWHTQRETLDIARTACHLGGTRPWLHCPVCWRRCAILYLTEHGLLCRTCGELNDPSTRQNKVTRAMTRVLAIRQRLGWGGTWMDGHGGKPEGMRWREYFKLVWKHDAEVDQATAALLPWLDKQHRQLEKRIGRGKLSGRC